MTIDISFVIIVAILGWYPGVDAERFVAWFLLVPVAVLVHELGHAFVARTTGAQPTITLAGLGGLTSYLPPHPLTRARSVAISLAGPAVGIVVGLALLAYGAGSASSRTWPPSVLNTAIFTTLGWSLLNLLPILPLDGGQTLRELLPGSPAKREVRAAMVSVVVAVLAALAALRFGLVFGALMAGVLRLQQRDDRPERPRPGEGRRQPARGPAAVGRPPGRGPRPARRATGRRSACTRWSGPRSGRPRRTRAPASPSWRPPPTGTRPTRSRASLLLIVHRAREDWAAARDLLLSPRGRAADPSTVLAVQTVAFQSGAARESAEIGEAFLHGRAGPAAGDLPRADRLQRGVRLGQGR